MGGVSSGIAERLPPGGERTPDLVKRFRSHAMQPEELGLADLGSLLEP